MNEEYWNIPVTWQEAGTLLVSKKEYPRLADAMEHARSDESRCRLVHTLTVLLNFQ